MEWIICIEQLKVMYSIDEEEIEKVKKEKEERTLKRNGINWNSRKSTWRL